MLSVNRYARPYYKYVIGKREVVGPIDGIVNYMDLDYRPCPAIRFKAPNDEINALRAKEKGSWKGLTIEEKKNLYRASFRQTFAEMDAPTAHWRAILGDMLMLISIPITLWVVMKLTVFPPLPDSFSDENKKLMVRFWIDNRAGEFYKVWDYENQKWLKKPFLLMKNKE